MLTWCSILAVMQQSMYLWTSLQLSPMGRVTIVAVAAVPVFHLSWWSLRSLFCKNTYYTVKFEMATWYKKSGATWGTTPCVSGWSGIAELWILCSSFLIVNNEMVRIIRNTRKTGSPECIGEWVISGLAKGPDTVNPKTRQISLKSKGFWHKYV